MKATLDAETKEALRKTIRGLRERLLEDLHAATEGEYRLSIKADKAGLREAQRVRRGRLEGWIDEQVRTVPSKEQAGARERFRREAEKEAAYTLLHRLVLLRLMEAAGLSRPAVVTGGYKSAGYREFREYAPDLCRDESEGYGTLLELVYGELALELPGLYGEVGLTRLIPVRPETLRSVVEALDAEALRGAWTDDTTLGWVYQFWNDPEREALDAKINDGRKIEPHEIASKTQMFTERYMVEWLLHNTLGQAWLGICARHGWTAEARSVLDGLESRRAAWRLKRERGEVALDALMPIESELEERWKYWVPQPLPESTLGSIRELRLLDPACGSGHFLVIAFELLAALYREEARHRGEEGAERWSERAIAEAIVEENLHGVDIDPRCIQIAAAALWLKAKGLDKDAKPRVVNLVAPNLRLADLPKDDPALATLVEEVEREVGLPKELTLGLVSALAGADHLGTLLRVDRAIEEQLEAHEARRHKDGALFARLEERLDTSAKDALLASLERFLERCSSERDLGLRLEGEQLAAGVRFLRIVREGAYDVVIGNPPYQGLSKTERFGYVTKQYPRGKADLYAAFLERGLELVRDGGMSALVTMRGWMFLAQFTRLRRYVLHETDLRALGDLGTGAFSSRSMDDVISTVLMITRRAAPDQTAVAMQAGPLADPRRDAGKPARRAAALLAHEGRYDFDPRGFEVINGEPIVYWWDDTLVRRYDSAPKLGARYSVRAGIITSDNQRFLRAVWELKTDGAQIIPIGPPGIRAKLRAPWVPIIMGGEGRVWLEPTLTLLRWYHDGIEQKVLHEERHGSYTKRVQSESFYFVPGVAFSMIGSAFRARAHRHVSVIGNKGASVFPEDLAATVCAMNRTDARLILQSLNPGIGFEVGDVSRLPVFHVSETDRVLATLYSAFGEHEAARETSVEFKRPGPSPWRYAQDWAQRAVDRPDGAPLPPYEPLYDPPERFAFVSFAIGVALGRFGADGEGILDKAPATALPAGILFVGPDEQADSLAHPAAAPLESAWREHGVAVGGGDELRDWLRRGFFELHRRLYESRPIYLPLSSAKRTFVGYVSIHRFDERTLSTLLADHLLPAQRRLDGEIDDLRAARAGTDKKQVRDAERRHAEVQKHLAELTDFIDRVREIAERGAPPADPKSTPREVDAPFVMDLDDGVMINASALWPLLEPQWKDPKKHWKELSESKGKKDYDWAHLAKRYWPSRVDEKCKEDPSLGVAHGCFWKYHPAKAFAWELRLQHELDDRDFRIDEPESDASRDAFLRDHPADADAILEKEAKRRAKKQKPDEPPESDDDAQTDLALD